MDWFSWLSKTGLEPSLVYEYGLALDHNELEEADIAYFNHEFLQSMGISIAKHRLEILKLARKEKGGGKSRPLSRLVSAIKKTRKCLAKYIGRWVHNEERAIVLVSKPNHSTRWRGAMVKRSKRLTMLKQGRLLLTNGSAKVEAGPPSVSPTVYNKSNDDDGKMDEDEEDEEDAYWGVEEIRWDAMFQDLKPT